jgi:hypothetical protein
LSPTLTLTPSQTLIPTLTVTPSPTLTPTATLPQGKLTRLFYDDNSFYIWNTSDESIPISRVAFEALDSSGVTTGERFEGDRWANVGYHLLEGGKCNAIEITQAAQVLRPTQCNPYFANYNAVVTPQRGSPAVFWLMRSGITHFRVLWDEQEVARCEAGGGQCEVYFP